jgi:hypothetical protein
LQNKRAIPLTEWRTHFEVTILTSTRQIAAVHLGSRVSVEAAGKPRRRAEPRPTRGGASPWLFLGGLGLADGHDNFTDLIVRFHVPVRFNDLVKIEGAGNDRLQFALRELIVYPGFRVFADDRALDNRE